ncbi:hypothetical protein [Streptomyces chrestomyceticus]|uniref:hypothetical protein n=1 Tax=Streptomyces chrestomyceticus TaxID=68185 RepID=UPI0033E50DB2
MPAGVSFFFPEERAAPIMPHCRTVMHSTAADQPLRSTGRLVGRGLLTEDCAAGP